MLRITITMIALALAEAKFDSKTKNLKQEIQAALGLFIFLVSSIIYFIYYREKKEIVEFQQFEMTNPPTPFPIQSEKITEKTEGTVNGSLK